MKTAFNTSDTYLERLEVTKKLLADLDAENDKKAKNKKENSKFRDSGIAKLAKAANLTDEEIAAVFS